MKKIYYIPVLALLAASCSEDNVPSVTPTPGEDVQFTSFVAPDTRTTYADEAGTDDWRINWLNGDMINVYTPQGASGFQQAPYKVVNTYTGDDGSETDDNTLNYAKTLVHVNETGVRWGDAATANFYAVYPYVEGKNNFSTTGTSGSNATITATVSPTQVNSVAPYINETDKNTFVKGDMPNNIMYAAAVDVKNGTNPVPLQFHPVSTVLQFKLGCLHVGASAETGTDQPITIRKITVTSPTGMPIAGDIVMDFSQKSKLTSPSLSVRNGSNSVSLETRYNNTYVTIPAGGSMTANLFITVPSDNSYSVTDEWIITVDAIEGTFSKTLTTSDASGNHTLLPGEIHQITLPKFSRTTPWTYETGNWISTLDKNIYWTELSLPGSWYSASNGSDKYQDHDIATQFSKGVRAFYLETRVGWTESPDLFNDGLSTNYNTRKNLRDNKCILVLSGGGSNQSAYGDTKIYYDATSAQSSITAVANAVKNTDEFAVLTLAYADGGSAGVSGFWRVVWLDKINSMLNTIKSAGVTNIYGFDSTDETLTANTTIDKLRGKVILKIDIDAVSEIGNATWTYSGSSYSQNAANSTANGQIPALFSYNSYDWTSAESSLVSSMTWKTWPTTLENLATTSITPTGFYCNYTVANSTFVTGTPTMTNRKSAISTMISTSSSLRKQGDHNVFFLCGAGGTLKNTSSSDAYSDGPTQVADGGTNAGSVGLNEYLAAALQNKIDAYDPSPLGCVYVNFVTGTTGQQLIKTIIEMNNKFYLERAEETTAPESQDVKSLSPNHSSAFKLDTETWSVF